MLIEHQWGGEHNLVMSRSNIKAQTCNRIHVYLGSRYVVCLRA